MEMKQKISLLAMIIFFGVVMFGLGYYFAYNQAIIYANSEITKITNEIRLQSSPIYNLSKFVVNYG